MNELIISDQKINIDQNSTDYVVATVKAGLGMVPFAGSILAELAGTIIPKQRTDRLIDFARKLESKLGELEKETLRAKLNDENFTDLLEETTRQAASAITDERRTYLSSLLSVGITDKRVSFIETKHLLRILSQINDIEIIWLRYYLYPLISGDDEFREKHASILEPVFAHIGSDQATIDKRALQESYVQHLVSLGLMERPLQIDSSTGLPIFDRHTRDWKVHSRQVTILGRLLLRYIGLEVDD
jgi:hypothetical protein